MATGQLRRQVERHKSKDAEKAAVAIAMLFGMSIALIVIGALFGFRSDAARSTGVSNLIEASSGAWPD
jgi:hypothetical protein